MLDWLAVATTEAIRWEDLGMRRSLFAIGGFELRWYSLAYLAGIVLAYWHLSRMAKGPGSPLAQRHADDLFFYCTLGVILGGRLGFAAFYKPELFTSLELFKLWEGGMSFHGGVLGVVAAIGWVAWRGKLNFIRVSDYIAVNVGFGMLFGRLANFVNGELWGRPSDASWAMIFPTDPLGLPRHPSQLYEAVLEGALIVAVMLPLFWKTCARYRPGLLVGAFTALIAAARFVVEFFREPDFELKHRVIETGLSQGQWLSLPLILVGLGLVAWSLMRPELGSTSKPGPNPSGA